MPILNQTQKYFRGMKQLYTKTETPIPQLNRDSLSLSIVKLETKNTHKFSNFEELTHHRRRTGALDLTSDSPRTAPQDKLLILIFDSLFF